MDFSVPLPRLDYDEHGEIRQDYKYSDDLINPRNWKDDVSDFSGRINEYIDQYLDMHENVLLTLPKPIKYEVENTFYVDEISNHGHESNGWRWTTYCTIYWEDGQNRIIRYNWQPKTYFIDEWGLDKPLPFKQKMIFKPRFPFRSRINVYDPKSRTTKLLRNIDKKDKVKSIPARFVAYNIELNQTVSVRFRVSENNEQYMEIGPIEDGLLLKTTKIK